MFYVKSGLSYQYRWLSVRVFGRFLSCNRPDQARSGQPAPAQPQTDPADRQQHRDFRLQCPGSDRSRQQRDRGSRPASGLCGARLDRGADALPRSPDSDPGPRLHDRRQPADRNRDLGRPTVGAAAQGVIGARPRLQYRGDRLRDGRDRSADRSARGTVEPTPTRPMCCPRFRPAHRSARSAMRGSSAAIVSCAAMPSMPRPSRC